FPSEFEKQAMQVLMLFRTRLAPVHGARCHVVDELVMLVGKAVLLTLAVERHFGPFELAISIAEHASAVLPVFRCPDAFLVTNGARGLDFSANFLLVCLA